MQPQHRLVSNSNSSNSFVWHSCLGSAAHSQQMRLVIVYCSCSQQRTHSADRHPAVCQSIKADATCNASDYAPHGMCKLASTLLCIMLLWLLFLQLLSSLIDAAERLRQFSPVKESFSSSVLEEVRWRLFRIVSGS